ncbi:PIN domain-containing protein [Candidatus Micrarchaeota archaeon]|nr:PIN domain-containing protein [Candidatus Micrarchaeota archaeon]
MLQNTATKRLFLDTNVLVAGSFALQPNHELLFNYPADKLTNEYAVKEYRRVLAKQGVLPHDTENALSEIRKKVRILPTPQKQEFEKINLTDKSDRPMVCSAMKTNSVLVTNDLRTYQEAQKYVTARTPKEILQGKN